MTARLVVRWPVLDLDLTLWGCEGLARVEWPAFVMEAGVYGTADPVFSIEPGDPPHLVGVADVLTGPVELRSHRLSAEAVA